MADNGVWVVGEGMATAQPDLVRLLVGIEAQHRSAVTAESDVSRRLNAVIDTLTGAGVAREEAIADARRRAEQLVAGAGATLARRSASRKRRRGCPGRPAATARCGPR